ncbi:winged helix DNA-binding domain-containing protein [Occultella glacieicola]|uniref:Winged helix DNA-binding domain-containing protein n=1 Tax=Occultella glacieicola TaxID=2518684 RepID=A0ABY2E8X5_9MICO|nr:winged helix DNA-binding domain-containing protein [Occultella glacieicola]TDE98966.1 winged helix DNA-binding domain-containing protein [Occultella glacieicola]
MITRRELALLRLIAQRLAGPRCATAADAVRHLGAAQAQDLPGALTSIALRVDGGTRRGVEEALATGQVVRSWPMRGTLHLVPAEDLGWMLAVTSPRMIAGAARRRAELGITDAVLDRAREIALDALAERPGPRDDASGGGATSHRVGLRRADLFGLWQAAGLLAHSQTAVHLLGQLCQEATLVLGPLSGTEQHVVAYGAWIPEPVHLDRDGALAEWARRYLRSHGPATDRDLARWASLSLTDARAGVSAVREEFTAVEVDGIEHLMDPALPDLLAEHRAQARRLRLLPGFDEFMLGYADRTFAVPAEFEARIVPGGNGMFRATVVKGGQVIATWKRAGTGARTRIAPEPFAPLGPRDRAAIDRRYTELP